MRGGWGQRIRENGRKAGQDSMVGKAVMTRGLEALPHARL